MEFVCQMGRDRKKIDYYLKTTSQREQEIKRFNDGGVAAVVLFIYFRTTSELLKTLDIGLQDMGLDMF